MFSSVEAITVGVIDSVLVDDAADAVFAVFAVVVVIGVLDVLKFFATYCKSVDECHRRFESYLSQFSKLFEYTFYFLCCK